MKKVLKEIVVETVKGFLASAVSTAGANLGSRLIKAPEPVPAEEEKSDVGSTPSKQK